MAQATAIFWFRRDLRIADNAGLFHALRENSGVMPVFIFDTSILDKLDNRLDSRVEFIHESVSRLKADLENLGSSLLTFHGTPEEFFKNIGAAKVFANRDYEPSAIARDLLIKQIVERSGGTFITFKDQVIFDHLDIVKDDGTPYTVFTPYSRKWKKLLKAKDVREFSLKEYLGNLIKIKPLSLISLKELGFEPTKPAFPPRVISTSLIKSYHAQRDVPSIRGTTRLGVHLRFGTISIRKLVGIASQHSEVWLNELIWREFFQMILFHFPHVVDHAFKSQYDRIEWRNNPDEFAAWREGRTGYPLVDAGMRELHQTGFMHNRVRMVCASFLTKHLLIDWRWGQAWFAEKLLDYELACNNGNWQWAASCGCDAAPYFRIFNPSTQASRFDPEGTYQRKWITEIGTEKYPAPIVVHSIARDRAISTYRKALAKD